MPKDKYPNAENIKDSMKPRKSMTYEETQKALSSRQEHYGGKERPRYSDIRDLEKSMKHRKPFTPKDYGESEHETKFNKYGEIIEESGEPSKDLTKKIISSLMFIIGALFVLNASSGMTGFAVAEGVGKVPSLVIGLVLIIGSFTFFFLTK